MKQGRVAHYSADSEWSVDELEHPAAEFRKGASRASTPWSCRLFGRNQHTR